jgi:uncharacterized HAD superfamily protein
MAKKKTPPEQLELPGAETAKIPELTRLAKKYVAARDSRMGALEIEVELKDKLVQAMKKHDIESYRSGDVMVVLTHGADGVKVKASTEEAPNDNAAESAA